MSRRTRGVIVMKWIETFIELYWLLHYRHGMQNYRQLDCFDSLFRPTTKKHLHYRPFVKTIHQWNPVQRTSVLEMPDVIISSCFVALLELILLSVTQTVAADWQVQGTRSFLSSTGPQGQITQLPGPVKTGDMAQVGLLYCKHSCGKKYRI